MKKTKFVLVIMILACLTVSCDLFEDSQVQSLDPYTMLEGYNFTSGKNKFKEKLEKIISPLSLDSITTITFQNEAPENYSLSGDLSAIQNGKVMGYIDDTNLYIAGKRIVAHPHSPSLFYGMEGLKFIYGTENLDVSNVTDMSGMFEGCTQLKVLHLNNWNTANVSDMGLMFCNCAKLESLDLSGKFDTSQVTDMLMMFSGCSSLSDIYVGSKWTTAGKQTLGMFMKTNLSESRKLELCPGYSEKDLY